MKANGITSRKYWQNIKTGQTASIYGAVPWYTESERANWSMVESGYCFTWPDGTVGNHSRLAFKSIIEASVALYRNILKFH